MYRDIKKDFKYFWVFEKKYKCMVSSSLFSFFENVNIFCARRDTNQNP